MINQTFNPAVRVLLSGGRIWHINDAARAGEVLLYRWPKERGPAHRKAREAIVAALESGRKAAAARKAFAAAAREANILLGE